MSGYKTAFDYALNELQNCNPEVVVRNALAHYNAETCQYTLPFFKKMHVVCLKSGKVYEKQSGQNSALGTGIMIMNYLSFAKDVSPSGRLITLKEVPGGEIFFPAFQKAILKPLAQAFSNNLEEFVRCAALLGGEEVKMGHSAAKFEAFPKVPLVIVLWEGDEEVCGSANFLYDSSVEYFSPTETIIGYGYFLVDMLGNYAQEGKNRLFSK